MADFSSFAEDELLRKILKDTAFTWAPVEMGLHTANPGNTGASEVTGGSYARVAIDAADWSDPVPVAVGSESENLVEIEILDMPAVTVTYASLWTTGGDFIMAHALAVPAVLTLGQTFRLGPGLLKVNMR